MSAPDYPVELSPPDLQAYRDGNTGIDYVYTFDSGKPGPHAMLSALVHGNELCGAIALDLLLQAEIRPRRGKLTMAFVNIAAFHSFRAEAPFASRYVDEDFNRLWDESTLDGTRDSTELRRARQLRPLLDSVDCLLDIHSMQHPCVPLTMCGPLTKGRELALAIGYPPHIVSDRGHAAGKRMRDYAAFADPASERNALLVECGQHWSAPTAEVAKQTAVRFLSHFELVDADRLNAVVPLDPGVVAPRAVEVTDAVTIRNESFRFVEAYLGMEVIEREGTVIGWDGDEPVRTHYDRCVLVMPSSRLYRGQTAVRLGRFIEPASP